MISPEDRWKVIGLIYNSWSQAFDALKAAQDEESDGSPDWSEFHQSRLETAQDNAMEWSQILHTFKVEWSDCIPTGEES